MLIDRPAARLGRRAERLRGHRRRARLVPHAATTRAAFERRRRARALRRGRRDRAQRRLRRGCSTTTSPPRSATTTSAGSTRIEYHTALCLLLELDRRFSPFYWTNIADPELPFVGLVEHTNFVEPERYDGRRFLYVANYLAPGDPLLELDADALLERYTPGLRKVNPGFDRSWVKAALAAPRAGRPADRHRRLPGADPAAADRRPAPRARQHDADLSRGPRAPTTPCGWAATPPRRCSRDA